MILLEGTDWQNAKAMIKIDVGMPAATTARQLAESFAKNTGGSVSTDTLNFDGEPGVIASTSSNDLTTPRNINVLYRDGKAYLLIVGRLQVSMLVLPCRTFAKHGNGIKRTFEEVESRVFPD